MDIETLMARVLFLVGFALAGMLVADRLHMDRSLGALGAGLCAGALLPWIDFDTGIRAGMVQPLIFFVVLPVLIFEATWSIHVRQLRRILLPALLLAIPGVLVSFAVIGTLVYFGIAHPQGFPWLAALLTAAILSATDPTAVVARLRSADASKELETLLESESLLNDATAILLFGVVLSLALGLAIDSPLALAQTFSGTFFGGPVVGITLGLAAAAIILWSGQPVVAHLLTLLTAFGTFWLAEHGLGVSGILAVVAAALSLRLTVGEQPCVRETEPAWHAWGEGFQALLFLLIGLTVTGSLFVDRWLAVLIGIGAMLAGRVAAVAVGALLARAGGYRIEPAHLGLLVWGGLRGGVAIALVLSLPPDELPYWYTIHAMVFGAVLFGLLVQATTLGRLQAWLKPAG